MPRPLTWQVAARADIEAAWAETPCGLEAWQSGEAPLCVAGPGSGKTLLGLMLAVDRVIDRGGRVLWLAHRQELLDQPMEDLRAHWPTIRGGIVQGARDWADGQIVFGSVDTLRNESRRQRILEHGPIDMIVVDEAHRSMTPTHQQSIAGMLSPGCLVLGLTATPDRADGMDLGKHWSIAHVYTLEQSIADGVTVEPMAAYVPFAFDLSAIDPEDDEAIGDALLAQGVVPATVSAMQGTHLAESIIGTGRSAMVDARPRPALVFTASVRQAQLTAEALEAAGWRARYVSGETHRDTRRALIKALAAGDVDVICNAMVLTEGTNIPRVSMSVIARPMRSWTLYVQSVTRSGRVFPDKRENFILDLTGATRAHNIMAAPVLIGGSPCKDAPDGIHQFAPAKHPKGECVYCGRSVACIALVGPHDFGDGHKCIACGSPQCPDSVDGAHTWVVVDGVTKACIDCGRETKDMHAGLANGPPPGEVVEAEWLQIRGLEPESFALDTQDHGMLLVTGDRSADTYAMWWVKKGSNKARRLGPETVPGELVRSYANDIARRAKRFVGRNPVTDAQRQYARQVGADLSSVRETGAANKEISRAKARAKLIALGLAREAF